MPSQTQTIQNAVAGKALLLRINADKHPQVIVGHVWRYKADGSPDGLVAAFSTRRSDVQLGLLEQIGDRLFLITGMVINLGDAPPTKYEVDADVSQEGNRLATLTIEGGTGTIGTTDQPFLARFKFA